jgi:4'-phosphopantetheinyl transferase
MRQVVQGSVVPFLKMPRIVPDGNGRPLLEGHPKVFLSISHGGNWILSVVSSNTVGIDVESIRDVQWRIVDRFYTDNESRYVKQGMNQASSAHRFLEVWTAKESYAKATGRGLLLYFRSFDTCSAGVPGQITIDGRQEKHETNAISVDPYHVCAICNIGLTRFTYCSDRSVVLNLRRSFKPIP